MHGPATRTARPRIEVRLRLVLAAVTIAGVVASGILVHLVWWRTANAVGRTLGATLEVQISEAARRAWWSRVDEVEGLALTVAEGLAGIPEPEQQGRLLATAMVTVSSLAWLVWLPDKGDGLALGDAPEDRVRVYDLPQEGGSFFIGEIGLDDMVPTGPPAPAHLTIDPAAWQSDEAAEDTQHWALVPTLPDGGEGGVAWVVRSDDGLLVAMLGNGRFAAAMGEIPVGRTGRSYVVGPTGRIVVAASHPDAPQLASLDKVAKAAGTIVAARPAETINITEQRTLRVDRENYAVSLSPLWFQGWQLAVIVPEREFLGAIDDALWTVGAGLIGFVLLAGAAVAVAAGRLVAEPIRRVAGDLELIERFELERVPRRRSRLAEIDRLSAAIVRMSEGLADFAKFIPTDLVRSILAEGVRAEPGGTRREITVLFADLAGFTSLSEQLGDDVVPVVSAYLDAASRAIAAHGGTVDKFIGDAVMAFWNAPAADPEHAANACRGALAIAAAVRNLGGDLSVRVGVQTGPAIVGNIGAPNRLNYTALGDTVNQASRLEGANKIYGTTVLIGEATRLALGGRLPAREIDAVVLYGRSEPGRIFELGVEPGVYEPALAAYREARFADALALLADAAPGDAPAARLAAECERLAAALPRPGWVAVTNLAMK